VESRFKRKRYESRSRIVYEEEWEQWNMGVGMRV
jgi:hypothetical protein